MITRKLLRLWLHWLMLSLTLAGCGGGSGLPGASGAPVEFVITPEVEVLHAFMASDYDQIEAPETASTVLPSGLSMIYCAITLKHGVNEVSFEIFNDSGPMEIGEGYWMTISDHNTGQVTYSRDIPAPDGGVFADGAYQTKVYLDGELVALLNWSIGE